ncbi:hypothetical protein WISP_26006 [Willisornis vidua]|uniref:Uncharacterized protein n=1 Tax=Willisornis vidua TaxID=1566151 RepID=A0ABQ9DLS3_9PASS|nr:hypothetical protein WISP_26006 [Willisornis vidua]
MNSSKSRAKERRRDQAEVAEADRIHGRVGKIGVNLHKMIRNSNYDWDGRSGNKARKSVPSNYYFSKTAIMRPAVDSYELEVDPCPFEICSHLSREQSRRASANNANTTL